MVDMGKTDLSILGIAIVTFLYVLAPKGAVKREFRFIAFLIGFLEYPQ